MTLTEFVLARIAEDEATARPAGEDSAQGPNGPISTGDDPWPTEYRFAERFTPARILAECEAKRRIVELHEGYPGYERSYCNQCADGAYGDKEESPCATLRLLALLYADHADYLDEWRP